MFKVIIIQGDKRIDLIAKHSTNKDIKTNYLDDNVETMLNKLGLEKVPNKDVVPKHQLISKNDEILTQQCTICHENYKHREYKRTLNCTHIFHKKCIDKWLKININCPMCRTEII